MASSPKKLEIGKEIKAHCGKCKMEMIHVITKIDDDKVKKVFCKGCNTTHGYKTTAEVVAKKAKSATKTPRRRKNDWTSLVAEVDDETLVDYDIKREFREMQGVRHKKFGVGVVLKVLDITKIEVSFQDGSRILVQNWE